MSRIKRVHCGDVNCHLVQGEQGAILVDTGRAGYGEKLLPLCRQWDVRLIVLTHGHLDHVQNAAFLSQQLEVPIAMHRADLELLEDNDRQPMQAHRRLGRLIQSLSRSVPGGRGRPVPLRGQRPGGGSPRPHGGLHRPENRGRRPAGGGRHVSPVLPRPRPGLCGPAADGGERGKDLGPPPHRPLLRPRSARSGVVKPGKTDYTKDEFDWIREEVTP